MNNLNSRQMQILEMLTSEGERSVSDLARKFHVSGMTIRRDLAVLEERGKVIRTWGSAMIAGRAAFDFSFREKALQNSDEKQRIGRRAASLVKPGNSVFLDTGTTTLQVASFLKTISDIQVFTCSLAIVSELFSVEGIALNMLGGTVNPNALEVYGPLTERNIADIQADIAFLGADAVGSQGELLTIDLRVARVSELIMRVSKNRVLVADHSKWKSSSPVKYGDLGSVDLVITGRGLPSRERKAIRRRGVELILV